MINKKVLFPILVFAFLLFVVGYTFFRSYVYQITFPVALDKVLVTVVKMLWNFITTPSIFISLLVAFILWTIRKHLIGLLPSIKEIKAGDFSAVFDKTALHAETSINKPEDKKGTRKSSMESSYSVTDFSVFTQLGKNSCNLLLDIDGKEMEIKDWLSAIDRFGLFADRIPLNINNTQKIAALHGIFEALYSYVVLTVCNVTVGDDTTTKATASLKPGVKEKLIEKITQIANSSK